MKDVVLLTNREARRDYNWFVVALHVRLDDREAWKLWASFGTDFDSVIIRLIKIQALAVCKG